MAGKKFMTDPAGDNSSDRNTTNLVVNGEILAYFMPKMSLRFFLFFANKKRGDIFFQR
jgi:hypothetical protein